MVETHNYKVNLQLYCDQKTNSQCYDCKALDDSYWATTNDEYISSSLRTTQISLQIFRKTYHDYGFFVPQIKSFFLVEGNWKDLKGSRLEEN